MGQMKGRGGRGAGIFDIDDGFAEKARAAQRHLTPDAFLPRQQAAGRIAEKYHVDVADFDRRVVERGAHGAFLSGAGPSVVAFTSGREMTVIYEMAEAARLHNLPGKTMVVNPAATGAYLVESE